MTRNENELVEIEDRLPAPRRTQAHKRLGAMPCRQFKK